MVASGEYVCRHVHQPNGGDPRIKRRDGFYRWGHDGDVDEYAYGTAVRSLFQFRFHPLILTRVELMTGKHSSQISARLLTHGRICRRLGITVCQHHRQ